MRGRGVESVFTHYFYSTTVREGKYKFVQILKKDIRDIKLCTEIIIAFNEVGK